MKKVLFTTIILFSLVLVGTSCNDSTTTRASKPSRLRETRFYNGYDEYNCEDFETWEQAQEVFESSGGVENDVHRLDHDKDGIACEALR